MSMDPAPPRTPYAVSAPHYSVSHQMVTTAFELPNYRIEQNLGVVRGIVVRSRNIFATIGAGLQTIVGGNITVWTKLCEQTRADAFDIMIQHASEIGANAVVGARYDTTEISAGVTEVLAYGTAVIVNPENPGESYRS
ncbi:MAG TPA: YbjQ family protein [Pyrinomonadaceae bacterium]